MFSTLDFEKTLSDLERRVCELKQAARQDDFDIVKEITRLEKKIETLLCKTYSSLSPWQTVQVARHPGRPHTSDYIKELIQDFVPLSGDRMFADDAAIIGGLGRFYGRPVMVMGHEKGKNTEDRIKRSFGMTKPEGYRKTLRLFDLAERFKLPVITFVDTAGAYAGVEGEERGASQAIAASIEKMLSLNVPVVTTIIGEGGSGGAVALACANAVLMLRYAVYSVISPEGCASILWRTRDKADVAAEALKVTAPDLLSLGVIDDIIPEPPGAGHRNAKHVIHATGEKIEQHLRSLLNEGIQSFKEHRMERFLRIGRPPLRVSSYKRG